MRSPGLIRNMAWRIVMVDLSNSSEGPLSTRSFVGWSRSHNLGVFFYLNKFQTLKIPGTLSRMLNLIKQPISPVPAVRGLIIRVLHCWPTLAGPSAPPSSAPPPSWYHSALPAHPFLALPCPALRVLPSATGPCHFSCNGPSGRGPWRSRWLRPRASK